MNEYNYIPDERFPVTFNPYKHHLGFLRAKVANWRKMEWQEAEKEIRLMGNNLIDLYTGKLSVDEILHEAIVFAEQNELTSPGKLAEWLFPLEYRKAEFSDHSFWVIKQGQDSSRFLHIHPGKYSPFTIRVKAPTLKTVIALKVQNDSTLKPDVTYVNKIRHEKLNLSPVKGLVEGKGIARLLADFNSL